MAEPYPGPWARCARASTATRTIGVPLWPRHVGNQCLLLLVAGALFGRWPPGPISWVETLARLFLQVCQVVIQPLLPSRMTLPCRGIIELGEGDHAQRH